jgi:MoaA/NifB/PqqE/SkfB family radical SAM enzyme
MHNLDMRLKSSKLKDLWIMLGQSCDHRCENCFESTTQGIDNDRENLSDEKILSVIDEAIAMGINEVGIPGAGEPFHPMNINTLFKIIEHDYNKGIHTTIFTHTGFFTEKIVKRLDKFGDKITLLVKFNSFKPEVQDKFDNVSGYTKKREKNLKLLFKYHFNDGKRLGLVTSILTINIDEIPDIFRYAKKNNLIVDIDTVLPRGRGLGSPYSPSAKSLKNIFKKMSLIDRKEFGKKWTPNATYLGEYSCNRYNHHLYITKKGDVIPCIGSRDVNLGNVKNKSLKNIWNSPEMKIIRQKDYDGECLVCEKFIDGRCFSCLGRYTKDLNNKNLLKTGKVHTVRCFAFKKAVL